MQEKNIYGVFSVEAKGCYTITCCSNYCNYVTIQKPVTRGVWLMQSIRTAKFPRQHIKNDGEVE